MAVSSRFQGGVADRMENVSAIIAKGCDYCTLHFSLRVAMFSGKSWHGLPARGMRHGQDARATVASFWRKRLLRSRLAIEFSFLIMVFLLYLVE
jgi:hypothetical protein